MNFDFNNVTKVMSYVLEVYRTRELNFTISGKDVSVKVDDKAHKPQDSDSVSAQVVLPNGKQGKVYVTVEVTGMASAVESTVKPVEDVVDTIDKHSDM